MKAFGAGLLLIAFSLIIPVKASCSYTYLDIHPAGWTESHAASVNARGEAAGYGMSGSGMRGFLWSAGVLTELLPPGATDARALWVNGRGDVAGTAVIGGRPRAFLYSGGRFLDPTPGWAFSEAAFVAEDGAVTGSGEFGAYISRNGVPELLPGLTVAIGANAAGQVLGSAENTARLFLPGTGYLNVNPPGASFVVPRGLNESGLVAVSSLQENSEKGFVYSGGFYIFMTPPGWSSSNAMAINNSSTVVGYGVSPAGRRSFIRAGAAYEELSFPGWSATEAVSLNDAGQVAGSGVTDYGETHAFMASPAEFAVPVGGSEGAPGGSGGGGCAMAAGGARSPSIPDSAINLLILFSPLLALLARRRRG
jgi:uncharacterized membrane protein